MQISANTAQLARSINDVNAKLDSMGNAGKKAARDLGTLKAIEIGRLVGAGVAAAASQLSSLTRSLVEYGQTVAGTVDDSNKLARSIGVTYRELAGLQLAGDLAGTSAQQLETALSKLQVQLGKAQGGSKEAVDAFASIGLSIDQLAGSNAAEQMQLIADAISQLPTPAERAAAAVAIFGKSGVSLLPFFENGGAFLEDMANEAERLGLSLNDLQADNVEAMNDAFTLAQKAIEGVVTQIVADLAPGIQAAADAFTRFVGDAGGASIGQSFVDGLLNVADVFAQVFDSTVANFTVLAESFGLFSGSIEGASSNLATVSDAFTAAVLVVQRIFNAFQNIGAAIANVLGRVVSAIGTAVSYIPGTGEAGASLEQFGQDLSRAAEEQVAARNKAFEDAYNRFLSGEAPNDNAATRAVGDIRAAIDRARDPINQIGQAVDAAQAKVIALEEQTGKPAENLRSAFEAYRQAAEQAASDGALTADETERLTQLQGELNGLLSAENAARQKSAAAAAASADAVAKQAEKDRQRIAQVQQQLDQTFTFDNFTIAPNAFQQAQDQIAELEGLLEAGFIDADGFQFAADQVRQGFEDAVRSAEQLQDLQLQYAEEVAAIDAERADALSRVSQEPLRVEDVRTSGGFAELVRLASGREDPAIEEARKQTQELGKISREIQKLGGTVEMI
jgi:hypothetical protein